MAKVTWLGEDSLHSIVTPDGRTIEGAGPSFTTWAGVKFPKNEAVELRNPGVVAKALNNQFFSVEEAEDVDGVEPQPKRRGRPPNKPEAKIEPVKADAN